MSRKNKGFTLAEVLIVLAILMILGGIATVNVIQYQRTLSQLEQDGIAKEIFVAAQVHLTAAESQGYLGITDKNMFGTEDPNEQGVYYYIVSGGRITNSVTADAGGNFNNTILGLMLPPGSVDETVLGSGSFIIRYHKDSAQVLDVFYCSSTNKRYGGVLTDADYELVMRLQDGSGDDGGTPKEKRLRYQTKSGNDSVLGWYGGVDIGNSLGITIENPRIIVHNEETLWVEILYKEPTAPSGYKSELTLWVRGKTSGVSKEIPEISLDMYKTTEKKYTLDDITQDDITQPGKHFYDLFCKDGGEGHCMISGEDIEIYAQLACYTDPTKSILAKTAISNIETTNSLFGDGTETGNAIISNFRHLENLDQTVSNLSKQSNLDKKDLVAYKYANQSTDLYWVDDDPSTSDFVSRIKTLHGNETNPSIISAAGSALAAPVKDPADETKTISCYYPVSTDYSLSYNGQGFTISNVKVDSSGDAGLFGKPTGTLEVSNLQLVDFNITGTTSAGALAGTLTNGTVTNVLARNSGSSPAATITASSGDAGGLVGSMSGGSISKSAAALVVSGGGNAGGLIGKADTGTTITACYSGGHTTGGKYSNASYNVTASSGNAGGLAGSFSGTKIEYSYSTCSASGSTASGGLVGSVGTDGGTITNCYSTGLVNGACAFIGSGSPTMTGNKYYSIINGKPPVSGYDAAIDSEKIKALDADAETYNTFVGPSASKTWASASAYDSKLIQYYQGKYNLKTVAQLGAGDMSAFFVARHYGDWPAPEVFVPNTKQT